MAIPTISPLPDPPIRGTDTGAVFSAKTAAWLDAATFVFVPELNQFAIDLVNAAAAAGYSGTSTSSMTIGTGSKSLVTQNGRMFVPGQWVTLADAAAPSTNQMTGIVTAFDFSSGAMTVNVPDVRHVIGSGTKTSWFVGLSGPQGPEGSSYPDLGGKAYNALGVNSASNDIEWYDPRWEQLATASPSAVTEQAFTSLKNAAYSDLLILADITPSAQTLLRLSLSADGSTYSNTANLADISARTLFAIQINGYRFGWGVYFDGPINPSAYPSPGMNGNVGHVTPWNVTGGIDALKLSRSTAATLSGTITVYGKR